MTKAIYPASLDPIHYGHMEIVGTAANVFDEVYVGIGSNKDKEGKYLFSMDERVDMAKHALHDYKNVTVMPFEGLLADFAYMHNIKHVVKGARNGSDWDFEKSMNDQNELQNSSLRTFILPAKRDLDHISSSAVKELQKNQGFIQGMVPIYVKQKVEQKLSNQYIVGVTGEIGSGKSYVTDKLVELGVKNGIPVHNLDLDIVAHHILERPEDKFIEIRETIANEFGTNVINDDYSINRKNLGEIVFSDHDALRKLNGIMREPIMYQVRQELKGKEGLILFNAALIAELELQYMCNNNVILVEVDSRSQESRLMQNRNMTVQQINRRVGSQYTQEEKSKSINEAITRDNNGKLWRFHNGLHTSSEGIENVFKKMVEELGIK